MPIGAQKQWRVPGPLGARINIPGPGRHNSEHKDKMKIKMPGMASSNNNNNNNNSSTTLPPISLKSRSGADGETENDHTGRDLANDNQMTHEENAELRKRRISTLSEQYAQYTHVLAQQGLHIEAVEGDGNCLFRAVAHQIYGDENLHNLVRQKCLDYMESESDFFSQFVEGGREMFPFYLRAKRMDACWGDDPEIEVLLVQQVFCF